METEAFVYDDVCVSPARQIGMHAHSCWELAYILCGAGERTIGNLTSPFMEGEIVLVPPGIAHRWEFDPGRTDADGNISNICVFFQGQLVSSMKYLFPEISGALERLETLGRAVCYRGDSRAAIAELLLSMRGLTAEQRLPGMMKLLLAISDTSESRFAGEGGTPSIPRRRLEKVRIYCACNYARDITLDEISRHAGMNRSSFCTFMRRQTGMTFSAYLNDMRLERARDRLLHTDRYVAEIAAACGFHNVTYFNRLFRARYGITPKSLRNAENQICEQN